MGNNEPLPPPPAPGVGPQFPPAVPPAAPPPMYSPPGVPSPPTNQFPPTQPMPPTQGFPGGPPDSFPPHGYSPVGPAAEPPARKTGLIVALGLVAIAAVVAGVLIFTSGDDDTTASVSTPVIPSTLPSITVPSITVPSITGLPTDDTLVITVPTATVPNATEPPSTAPATTIATAPTTAGGAPSGMVRVTDDLNKFSVALPESYEVDTTPVVTKDNFTLPSVAGAVSLDAYNGDDVTPGLTVIAVGPDVGSSVDDVVAFLEPDDGVCGQRELNLGYPTSIGTSTMIKLDGCGADSTGSKVIIVVSLIRRNSVIGIYAQGTDASSVLLPLAQQVIESLAAV
ncbi:MAG: hypothetical protein WCC60_19405 [Ilumatobacteraceae bacterium]